MSYISLNCSSAFCRIIVYWPLSFWVLFVLYFYFYFLNGYIISVMSFEESFNFYGTKLMNVTLKLLITALIFFFLWYLLKLCNWCNDFAITIIIRIIKIWKKIIGKYC